MLVKIGPRLIDESQIECIHPSRHTDHRGLTHDAISVVMNNGNLYKYMIKNVEFEIDELDKRLQFLRQDK